MDRNKAESMLVEARAELATAESAVIYLRQVVSGLEGLLKTSPAAHQSMFPSEQPDPTPQTTDSPTDGGAPRVYPRPTEAVIEVLRARPNYPFAFKQVWDEMQRRDLVDPSIKSGRNAYTTAIRRLAESRSSGVTRDEHRRFTFSTNPEGDRQASPMDGSGDDSPTPLYLQAVKP